MKLSVIIPIYNTGELLLECIYSIKKQTYCDYELIFVDDKSDDKKTLEILKSVEDYAKLISLKRHAGAASARNSGLKSARGQYVIFLDSDDFFEPDFFEIMIDKIERYNADVCVCGHRRLNLDGDLELKIPKIVDVTTQIESISCLNEDALSLFPLNAWSYIINRRLLIENYIEFQTLPLNNDVYFVLSILINARGIIVYGDKPLISHRVGLKNQITSSYDLWTVTSAFSYLLLHEKISDNTELYYKIMYVWIKSVPEGIKMCPDYYMAKQTYMYLREFISKNSQFREFTNNEVNRIVELIKENPIDFSWVENY